VTRMRRNPSSGINAKDADIILKFLLYYSQRAAEEESGERGGPYAPASEPVPSPQPPPSASEPANPKAPEGSMTEPATTPSDGGLP
jgi:hypothetical protein